jgi:hypothetical protein
MAKCLRGLRSSSLLVLSLWACSCDSREVHSPPPQLVRDEARNEWVLGSELALLVEQDEALGVALQLGLDRVAQAYGAPPAKRGTDLDPHRAAMEERLERVTEEIEALGEHDWAGSYTEGGYLTGHTLSIAPNAGAVWVSWGCMGVYDFSHGDIASFADNLFTLELAFDPELNGTRTYDWYMPMRRTVSDEWHLVRWGDERYLIQPARMIEACNSFAHGGSLRPGMRRTGRAPLPNMFSDVPDGQPEILEPYRPFLLGETLSCTIVRAELPLPIGRNRHDKLRYRVRAEVDIGAEQGLLPGMSLRVTEPGEGVSGGMVVWADVSRALVEFRGTALHEDGIRPRVGWSMEAGPR